MNHMKSHLHVTLTKQDLLDAIERGNEYDKYVKEALARGGRLLIIDENVEGLKPHLMDRRYDVIVAKGKDEYIKEELLWNHIFITNNGKHFISTEDRVYYHYGLIIVPHIDYQLLANYIEKCLMKAGFKNNLGQVWEVDRDGSSERIG